MVFESAELSHRIDKATFARELPLLRESLLEAQVGLVRGATFSVVILVAGTDGAGRGEIVNLLNEWMDPRHIRSHGMGDPAAEENERPVIWRFWRVLPPKGKIGLFLGSWYTWPLLDRAYGKIKGAQFAERMRENARFEKMLVDEGTLVLKFWMHLSKAQQRNRLKSLQKDRLTRWRVTERDWTHYQLYDKLHTAAKTALTLTSTAEAPWLIVSGDDRHYRNLTVGRIVLEALRKRLAAQEAAPESTTPPPLSLPSIDNIHLLKSLDLGQTFSRKNFAAALEKYQGKLSLLTRNPRFRDTPVVVAFEGNDAAGKGGAIRRITAALDARMYQVVPIAAPSDEERARPYLWRFWRHVPRRGRITIFDRSWYGRVLVERVEGLCLDCDWMRAYNEIVDFESQLTRNGFVVVKFWLSISKDEQLRRFRERKTTGFKRFKITDEDWRNRKKWNEYEMAVCNMVDRTSTPDAPWTLVEANDKSFARIKILKTLCRRIEASLDR